MVETAETILTLLSAESPFLAERCRYLESKPVAKRRWEGDCGIQGGGDRESGPVVYWTHHALRVDENPALEVAIQIAISRGRKLIVYYGLSESYRFASDRHHWFTLQGARDLVSAYEKLGITFVAHVDRRSYRVPALRHLARSASVLVTDDFPGEPTQQWIEGLMQTQSTLIVAVDTACILPMRLVGKAYERAYEYKNATRKEYRNRIPLHPVSLLEKTDLAAIRYEGEFPFKPISIEKEPLADLIAECDIDHSIGPVGDTLGGFRAGYERWTRFKEKQLKRYERHRNDPLSGSSSRMSAYLHFGMVSPMRLAREAQQSGAEKFLEELLIWREMAYAFCFYRDDYETTAALPDWAVETLKSHESDRREDVYSLEMLSRARTQDPFWNACQKSLLMHGELHNNVRMTWGKAILNWSRNSGQALRNLIDLNHRYALDGRDPASYGGILWCLGQFDRPFYPETPIFGTVRSRSTHEHAARLDLDAYSKKVSRPVYQKDMRVAVIGAGLGGLLCARILSDHGLQVTVFDKSRGSGGRAATRRLERSLQFDHGAQYFICRDARIARYVDSWMQDEIVRPWAGRIVELQGGEIVSDKSHAHRLVGVPTMSSLGRHLANDLRVNYQSKVTKVEERGGRYLLQFGDETNKPFGIETGAELFDSVVFNAPAPQTQCLLPSQCCWRSEMSRAAMKPCWSVMVAFADRWNLPFDGAFLNHPMFAWMARDSSKPGRPQELDCWVIHSDPNWAESNLHIDKDQVPDLILGELARYLKFPMPEPLFRQSQRWMYAASASGCVESDFLWDDKLKIGACGDWFRKPNIEGAILSGIALAGRILGELHQASIDIEQEIQFVPRQLELL